MSDSEGKDAAAPEAQDPKPKKPTAGARMDALEQTVGQMQEAIALQQQAQKETQAAVAGVGEGQAQILQLLEGMRAQDRGTVRRGAGMEVHAEGSTDIVENADGFQVNRSDRGPNEAIEALTSKDEIMRFMAEPVEVMVNPSQDPLDFPVVEFQPNGQVFRFIRGVPRMVPRYCLEVMARSVQRTMTAIDTRDPDRQNRYKYVTLTGARFPMSVTQDTPQGRAWLRHVEWEEADAGTPEPVRVIA